MLLEIKNNFMNNLKKKFKSSDSKSDANMVPQMVRLKIVGFFLACLILWQTLRYFYTPPELSRKGLVHLGGAVVTSVGSPLSPVRLSVFYEALCPDSRSFFTKQLLPTYEKIPRLVHIDLVPYGKAKTERIGESLSFSCQHGPVECQANKIHACAISKIPNAERRLRYVTCMITDNMNPELRGEQCAQKHGIPWSIITECATSSEGDQLLLKHGEATSALHPHVSFIPTVLLNESQANQPGILKNLFKEVCNKIQPGVSQRNRLMCWRCG